MGENRPLNVAVPDRRRVLGCDGRARRDRRRYDACARCVRGDRLYLPIGRSCVEGVCIFLCSLSFQNEAVFFKPGCRGTWMLHPAFFCAIKVFFFMSNFNFHFIPGECWRRRICVAFAFGTSEEPLRGGRCPHHAFAFTTSGVASQTTSLSQPHDAAVARVVLYVAVPTVVWAAEVVSLSYVP